MFVNVKECIPGTLLPSAVTSEHGPSSSQGGEGFSLEEQLRLEDRRFWVLLASCAMAQARRLRALGDAPGVRRSVEQARRCTHRAIRCQSASGCVL